MAREKFTTTLESDLIKKMKIHAIENGRNSNEIIEEAIALYIALVNDRPLEEVIDLFPTSTRLKLSK